MNQRTRHNSPRTAAGFTLMEVLVAMGIFVVGMVGIAAVFPVAISLQQAATREVQGVQAKRNAEALLRGVGVKPAELYDPNPANINDQVNPVYDTFFDQWSLVDRGYPRSLTPSSGEAEFYWVPLYRDKNGDATTLDDVSIYLFIVARQPNTVYPTLTGQANPDGTPYEDPTTVPKVIQAPVTWTGPSTIEMVDAEDWLRIGDQVLDNNGSIYTIDDVVGDTITVKGIVPAMPAISAIWYAQAAEAGGTNPTVAIVQLDNLVQP